MRYWPLLLIIAAGCSKSSDSLMPLAVGKQWEYEIPPPIGPAVETFKVTRRVPVAGREGYELSSRFGVNRLVWKDGILYASQTAGAQFAPAIEMYAPSRRIYRGQMTFLGEKQSVEGIVSKRDKRERVKLATTSYQAEVIDVRLDVKGGYYILTNYFTPNVGLVQQDLRHYTAQKDTLVSRLRLFSSR